MIMVGIIRRGNSYKPWQLESKLPCCRSFQNEDWLIRNIGKIFQINFFKSQFKVGACPVRTLQVHYLDPISMTIVKPKSIEIVTKLKIYDPTKTDHHAFIDEIFSLLEQLRYFLKYCSVQFCCLQNTAFKMHTGSC